MITVQSINKYDKRHGTVLTIGTFDGVHIGHQKIVKRLINIGVTNNLQSTLLTFFPHPRMVLQKDSDIKMLNTIAEKNKILEQLGLNQLIIHPFTREFSRLTAVEFVRDMLVNKLNAKKIIIGYDHRFGRNRNANITDLVSFGGTYGFTVDEITAQEVDDVSVSSTKIRTALGNGDIATANAYLGYSYMLTGIVITGKKLGRQLEFPTANIYIEEDYKLIPKTGVYAVQSVIDGVLTDGMMNIGFNPTVNGTQQTIEVHFFNFNQDIYNKTLQIDILERIRDEKKFDSVDALKLQLKKDSLAAKKLIQITKK